MKQVTLSVKDLKKKIGDREIIKGIDFELKEGEVFGFLGPNGAGKTTTIRMLVGLIKPSSGSIKICGYDVRKDFTKAMQHMGCIVENPELYPFLSGWDNLLHFARMLPDVGKQRITEVVELVGLQARIHDKVKTYSLGMRQRLGIAQAMLNSPKLLILDEPTNGLDPAGIREMRQFIRKLAEEEGMSVLVSSHLLGEIQQLCDRVAIIKSGEIIQTDTVESLLATQERILWRVEPLQKGVEILGGFTEVIVDHTYIITAYDELETPEWNAALNRAGVKVHEMNRKLPGLEELFLQVTGGGGAGIE
ncbi:ABC transporter ATP-binding protein [Peribacillus muralis]|uniref:ABC transporter ATP-binding protein n=1 Tax=Peribacillus muralis TaxID=264697 RepID=UPI001F4D8808|nr:ABC transporter ATP-binding protein [Peribacillus muralis]MCK1991018.1 ABC transporter ATP-binding protein [Peribacillus muralis]MCK2011572.1 ABC transporter ATP-binding protein [Peribacillus muralis]